MIRVGLIESFGWQGGANYFSNLLNCYCKYPNPAMKLIVFTARPEQATRYQSDAIEICPWPEIVPGRVGHYPRRLVRLGLGYDPVLLRVLERHKIDLLTHNRLGKQTKIDTLHWQPDFQHRVYPQFFSRGERACRDAEIGLVQHWGNILLSSHSAAADFRRFYPELAAVQAHILHFSGAAVLDVVPLPRKELEAQYPVREPYFFLPNQFWQHKNHSVVVEALKQTAPQIRVICTGPMKDYRNASHVPKLLDQVKQAGLEDRFICLGTVPYAVMVSLMHHSVAVLQPSRFEGWSTTVEESKAMIKKIIISNIDVHLEQAPERGVYFSPDSAEELAACLKRTYAEFDPATEESFANQRQQHKTTSERGWVQDFANIIKAVSSRALVS